MAKKKKQDDEKGAYWMDTYGDMVTLLMTFFVLLFAMSNMDEGKFEMFIKAFQGTITDSDQIVINVMTPGDEKADILVPEETGEGDTVGEVEYLDEPTTFNDLFIMLQQYVEANNMQGSVELVQGDGFTFIQFKNNLFFDGDSSVLRPEAIDILDFMGVAFNAIPEYIGEVAIYGHTARGQDAETPNDLRFDWELSSARAINAGVYLMEKTVMELHKFSTEGFGENRPIVPHDGTEETRQANRRVEFLITEEGSNSVSLDEVYDIITDGGDPETYIYNKLEEERLLAAAKEQAAAEAAAAAAAAAAAEEGRENVTAINFPKYQISAIAN